MAMTSLAAVYLRLSNDRDGEGSTARQEADCRARASYDQAEVTQVFKDLVSGYRADVARPGFEAALNWATAGPGRTLYVWKLDRLSRRGIGQVGNMLDRLEDAESRVVFVQDHLDSSFEHNRASIALVSEQARSESSNMSVRTRRALADRKAQGLWPGGQPPYGFRIVTRALKPGAHPESFCVTDEGEPGTLVEDPETAPILREIVARIIDGESLYAVTSWLAESEIPGARGGTWRAQTLVQMLRSPVLLGQLPEAKGATEPLRDPETLQPVMCGDAIIEPAERLRLLKSLDARARHAKWDKNVGGRRPRALLTGVARCGPCGGSMTGGGSEPYLRYACSLKASGGNCPGNTVSLKRADEYVVDLCIRRWAAMEPDDPVLLHVAGILLGRPVVDPLGTAERDALKAELAEYEAKLDRVMANSLDPGFMGPRGAVRFAHLRDPLLEAIASLTEQLNATKELAPDLGVLLNPVELREGWEQLNLQAKRGAVAATVDSIQVLKSSGPGKAFDGDARLRVHWREDVPLVALD
jgi:site-specific DNA recombinase